MKGKIWASLDTASYNLDTKWCEKLLKINPISIGLRGIKVACRTLPGCNVVQFNPSSNNYEYLKCPIPLPLGDFEFESNDEFDTYVYEESKL